MDGNEPNTQPTESAQKRSGRLKDYDYAQAGAYFVTLVTAERNCIFGEIVKEAMHLSDLGKTADACWRAIPEHFPAVELGAFVVMPNHLHGILVIHESGHGTGRLRLHDEGNDFPHKINIKPGVLSAVIRSYRSTVSYRTHQEHDAAGIWQRNYYERLIHNEREMDTIWRYIEANPAQWDKDDQNPANNQG